MTSTDKNEWWTAAEDALLRQLVAQHGSCWAEVACGIQVGLRF